MNILTTLAQVTPEYEVYTTTTSTSGESGITPLLVLLPLFIIITVGAYVLGAILLGRILRKAGLAQWPAWVPFYNSWKLFQIGGQQGWLFLLSLIPFVNIVAVVFMYIAMYHIGLKLQKPGAFVLLAIFFPIVWYIWLAFDSSTWDESLSSAPSLAEGPYPEEKTTPSDVPPTPPTATPVL